MAKPFSDEELTGFRKSIAEKEPGKTVVFYEGNMAGFSMAADSQVARFLDTIDARDKRIEELWAEIKRLQSLLTMFPKGFNADQVSRENAALKARLVEATKLIRKCKATWDGKRYITEDDLAEFAAYLAREEGK